MADRVSFERYGQIVSKKILHTFFQTFPFFFPECDEKNKAISVMTNC